MKLTPIEFKKRFIEDLFKTAEYIKQVNDVEYRTRCPFCGDSEKNLNTGHLYLRISLDDNYPIVYNCFKCPASGILKQDDLKEFGIDDLELIDSLGKVSSRFAPISGLRYHDGESFQTFQYELPDNIRHRDKIHYMEERLGFSFTDEMISDMKIITSLKEFLVKNKIATLTCEPYIAQKLEDNYLGFLSYGNSHILFRDVTNREQISWIKYPISNSSRRNYVAYSLNASLDLFTTDTITINLCEGVADILSICYNLGYDQPNVLNMCACGKMYKRLINHIISRGLVGGNVILNIFSDNDAVFNRKSPGTRNNNYDTTIDYYKKSLHEYTYLFKEVNVYYNRAYKDYGTQKNNIELKKYRL